MQWWEQPTLAQICCNHQTTLSPRNYLYTQLSCNNKYVCWKMKCHCNFTCYGKPTSLSKCYRENWYQSLSLLTYHTKQHSHTHKASSISHWQKLTGQAEILEILWLGRRASLTVLSVCGYWTHQMFTSVKFFPTLSENQYVVTRIDNIFHSGTHSTKSRLGKDCGLFF